MDYPQQIYQLISAFRETLAGNLVGIYLHGSLAMGCFHPERSDIDLLVVTHQPMNPETKGRIAEILLSHSGRPHPVEISFLAESQLIPWQYPTPFDFHFSEDWRDKTHEEQPQTDPDLAAHITIIRQRGICLFGKPIEDVFPPVPHEDYLDSILKDFEFARNGMAENPVYAVLNFCRIYHYLVERKISSKAEAGRWAAGYLSQYEALIMQALHVYEGKSAQEDFDESALKDFADYLEKVCSAP